MAIVRAQEAASLTFKYNYQVFLSFRGPDTRKTFTDHLYTALVQAGLRTFIDDNEIERGKRLELELGKAIQQSRISIIVLSKNYASSKWCLNEVLMILEWSRTRGHEVLPVFYDVNPSDVKNQTGCIGEAFASYKKELIDAEVDDEKMKEWMEKVKSWKAALEEVANLAGMVLQNQANGHEAKFIQEIINEVEHKLNRAILYVGRHLVGMRSRAEKIITWVQSSSSSVNLFVICGMGGIGKTTIAKLVYNLNFQKFEGSCFLDSVKERSRQYRDLVNLQAQLLSSILKGKRQKMYNIDEGITKINEAMYSKRILLVIDDVDEVKQLDALLGTREFYPGSKIIITTRDASLLKAHEVHILHRVQELDFDESLELFCWHAFGKEHPNEGYREQSVRAIIHCGGLPLAHKVLGSSLAGNSKILWASTLEKLEAIPEPKILNVLKISFESLQDDHDKSLFLHIACFFVRHDTDETIGILTACDFFTPCGIRNLIDKCLISIDESNLLKMHQLLQEMGRHIVDQESPKEPGRRSRVWRPKDSFLVLKEKKGTESIEVLMLDMRMYKDGAFNVIKGKQQLYDESKDTFLPSNQGNSLRRHYFNFLSSEPSSDVGFNYDAFSRMDGLRLLKLNYAKLSGRCEKFPKGLRCLCWHGFPLTSIPFDLPLENLVSLDMSYSKLECVWAKNKVLLSLKILNLSHSQRLLKTPNFIGLPNLEILILNGCVSLFEVCENIGNLERLAILNLKNCKSLRKFPNIGNLKLLQTLVLHGCSNIGDFPMDLKNMVSLKMLNINGVTTKPLTPTRRDDATLWQTLFQPWLSKPILKNPQDRCISLPCSLVTLSLRNCNLSDDDFPLDFSNLSILQDLDLGDNLFLNLPQCVRSLRKLSCLGLTSCKELISISGLPNVKGLYEFGIFSTFLRREEIPSWCGLRNNSNSSSSSSVSFVVPSHPNLRLQGLNVYSVYKCSGVSISGGRHLLFTKINNKTKDLKWIYPPMAIAILEKENEEEELVWLSHWKFGNQLESGDGIDVLVISDDEGLEVKEFGIKLVWGEKEENEEMKARTDHHDNNTRGVIGGDLSDYQAYEEELHKRTRTKKLKFMVVFNLKTIDAFVLLAA
ncbi:hypothetical protein LguiA_026868 [Lonicera macranthoides]